MAEILISLTIIGVIAAITLPSLQANINEKTWATQRKALYSRMSQAIGMLPSLNGYGVVFENGSINETETASKAAQAFITDGLSKVLKISNICDNANLKKCGFPDKITKMGINSKMETPTTLVGLNSCFNVTNNYVRYSQIDTQAAAFETANGESVAVFYNPLCQPDMGERDIHFSQPKMCADFVYDLNGKKGPNKVGKDVGFITALYPVEPNIVAPMPLENNAKNGSYNIMVQEYAAAACRKQNQNSRLPNRDEITAIFYNMQLLGISSHNFWSGSIVSSGGSGTAWGQAFHTGQRGVYGGSSNTFNVRCVKR